MKRQVLTASGGAFVHFSGPAQPPPSDGVRVAGNRLLRDGAPFVPEIHGAELGITSNEMFGLENIADAKPSGDDYPQLSAEYVVSTDPDLVFLAESPWRLQYITSRYPCAAALIPSGSARLAR